MKKILLALVTLMASGALYAQNSLVATLTSGSNVTAYYGETALAQALEAAQAGDAISLSGGTFQAADITKPVSICGAGLENDESTNVQRTVINGNFDIKGMGDDEPSNVTLEGLYMDNLIYINNFVKDASFIKCRFKDICSDGIVTNLNIMHCKIFGGMILFSQNTVNIFNSYVKNPMISWNSDVAYYYFKNCFVNFNSGSVNDQTPLHPADLHQTTYENCIINTYYTGSTQAPIPADSKATYCVGNVTTLFNNQQNLNNQVIATGFYTQLFGNGGASRVFTDEDDFKLTEQAAATYLGSDGTQVGMYGGGTPFNVQPANPKITKCIVAGQTSADGTLSVDIEVVGAE